MLDSNLPTYFFRPSTDRTNRYDYSLLFTQNGSEPDPRYVLRFPDPTTPIAKNVYACALFDAYIPEILYGEVLLKPDWAQPTLSAQEIRAQSGIPPAPAPVIPAEFAVQLYNPDQQVVITEKSASWGSSTYHFTMPQFTFRTPSGSTLDRGTHDPAADVTTPLLKFVWRKEGTLSNNLACFLTGKSTDTNQKKKGGKEPDIMVALLNNYRDLTIYESNFHRIDMEDYKGLEIVLLLCSSTLRDVYCGQRRDCFNAGETARKNSGGILRSKKSTPMLSGNANASSMNLVGGAARPPPPLPPASAPRPGPPGRQPNQFLNNHGRAHSTPAGPSQPPPPDPREQWQIEAESVRLRKQQEAEKRNAEIRRREKEKADEAEAKKIRKMVEAEDKQRRKREAEIERETERLRRQYGDQSNLLPHMPLAPSRPQRQSVPVYSNAAASHTTANLLRPSINGYQGGGPSVPYLQPAASVTSFFHGPSGAPPRQPKPKKSFLGLRRASDVIVEGRPLNKKKSSFW